jgi:hypothetical protein
MFKLKTSDFSLFTSNLALELIVLKIHYKACVN